MTQPLEPPLIPTVPPGPPQAESEDSPAGPAPPRWTHGIVARLLRNVLAPVAIALVCFAGFQRSAAHNHAVEEAEAGLSRTLAGVNERLDTAVRHFDAILATLLTQGVASEFVKLWTAGELEQASLVSDSIESSCEQLLELQGGILGIEFHSAKGQLFLSVAGGAEPTGAFDVLGETWFDSATRKSSSFSWVRGGVARITRKHAAGDLYGSLIIDFEQLAQPAVEFASVRLGSASLILAADTQDLELTNTLLSSHDEKLGDVLPATFCRGSLRVEQALESALAGFAARKKSLTSANLIFALGLLAALWIGLQQTVLRSTSTLAAVVEAFHGDVELPDPVDGSQPGPVVRHAFAAGAWVRSLLSRGRRSAPREPRPRAPLTDELARAEEAFRDAVRIHRQGEADHRELAHAFERRVAERTNGLLVERDAAHAEKQARAEFLSSLSLGMRTPLGSALQGAEQLLETHLSHEQRQLLHAAHGSTSDALRLLDQVGEYTALEAGHAELEAVEFNLQGTVEDLADAFAPTAHDKGLELTTEFLPGAPHDVVGDPIRLCEVAGKLLQRMIQLTDQGEVLLRVSPSRGPGSTVTLLFEVWGSATRVDETLLRRDLSPVARSARAGSGHGDDAGGGLTDLSLAICSQLTRKMHGEIGLRGGSTEGCTLWFTAQLTPGRVRAATLEASAGPESLQQRRLLIVDDNATARRVLAEKLVRWGATPTLASSAREAVTMLQEATKRGEPFEAALIDLHMPELDGLGLARWIKDDVEYMELPLVLLTPPQTPGEPAPDTSSMFSGRLRKPLRETRLAQALSEALPERPAPVEVPAPLPAHTKPAPPTGSTLPESDDAGAPEADDWAPDEPTHVLLVEDAAEDQHTTAHLLQRIGCDLRPVTSGREALDAIETEPFHAVLVDCDLSSEMTAYQLAGRIRKRHDLKASIPIIGMTADGAVASRDRCMEAGMDDSLEKPAPPKVLGAMLKRWVSVCSHLTPGEREYIAALRQSNASSEG